MATALTKCDTFRLADPTPTVKRSFIIALSMLIILLIVAELHKEFLNSIKTVTLFLPFQCGFLSCHGVSCVSACAQIRAMSFQTSRQFDSGDRLRHRSRRIAQLMRISDIFREQPIIKDTPRKPGLQFL